MPDIRFNLKKSVQWKGSLVLYFITVVTFLLQFTSLALLFGLLFRKRQEFPKLLTEIWLLLILFAQATILFCWQSGSVIMHNVSFFIALYFLLDSLSATLRVVFLAPNLHAGVILIYDRQRWLILTLITIIEVILSFAILIMYYHDKFSSPVEDPLTSIYVSCVSFLTVGYGDFYPTHPHTKILILSELGFFLLFLSLKLPIAVAMIKVGDHKKADE